jgi:thioredoxin-dependent peroxiredoxin
MVAEGERAPDFELRSDAGEAVSLSGLRGKPVVLYFYPRSDTPGCTKQACAIRDAWGEFERRGAVVLGVSTDSERAQARFKEKCGLPFTILADPERTIGDVYGVSQEGKESYERSTFLIDEEGNVAKVLKRVDPGTHADQVLAELPA